MIQPSKDQKNPNLIQNKIIQEDAVLIADDEEQVRHVCI